MKRLSKNERTLFNEAAKEAGALDADLNQRFLNALFVLSQSNPQWMVWVEKNLPRRVEDLYKRGRFKTYVQMLESAARFLVLKNYYGFFGRRNIGELVFNIHYPFTDDGHLRMW